MLGATAAGVSIFAFDEGEERQALRPAERLRQAHAAMRKPTWNTVFDPPMSAGYPEPMPADLWKAIW